MGPELNFWTVSEIAKILRLDPQTIRIMIRDGDIGSHLVGVNYLVSEQDLISYLDKVRGRKSCAGRPKKIIMEDKNNVISQKTKNCSERTCQKSRV